MDARAGPDRRQGLDYSDPQCWEDLGTLFTRTCQPRATGLSGYWECPPGWRWSVTLRDFDLWLVLRGSGVVTVLNHNHDVVYEVGPGSLLLLRPGDVIAAEQDPHDLLTVVASHLDFFAPGTGEPARPPDHLLPGRDIHFPDLTGIERTLLRIVHARESQHRLAEVETTALLTQALVEAYRQDAANHGYRVGPRDYRLERVITRLQQTPRHRLSLKEAARVAGLSPDYFSRLFAREMGLSYRDYIMQLRLERSRALVEETDLGISEIAHLMGYADIALFSRQYKARFGHAPSRAR